MHVSKRQKAVMAILFSGALTMSSPLALSVAVAEESAGENASDEAVQDRRWVSSSAELLDALDDARVSTILLKENMYLSDPITIDVQDREVTIDLNGSCHLSFDGSSENGIVIESGNITIRNGFIFQHSTRESAYALEQRGGKLTLGEGLHITAFSGTALTLMNDAQAIVDGAHIESDSMSLPCTVVNDEASLTIVAGEMTPGSKSRNLMVDESASVVIKGGTFGEEQDSIKAHVAAGYAIDAGSSRYVVRGDLSSSLATITLEPTSYLYDGQYKKPAVTVTFDDKDVTNEVWVTYANNREVGTATVTVEPSLTSDLTGTASTTFEIKPSVDDLANAEVIVAPSVFMYDGTEHKPSVWVTLNGHAVSDEYYSLSYSNNVNAGTATVTITANGSKNQTATSSDAANTSSESSKEEQSVVAQAVTERLTGSTTATFEIKPRPAWVTANNYTKTAGESDPAFEAVVTGTIGSDKLTYTISREQGETVGFYRITPTGKTLQGNYDVSYVSGWLSITIALPSTGSSTTTTVTPSGNTGTNAASSGSAGATTAASRAATPATADASVAGVGAAALAGASTVAAGMRFRKRHQFE